MTEIPKQPTRDNAHEQIVSDSRHAWHRAYFNQTANTVLELVKAGKFVEAEDMLHAYGVWLETRPDALEALSPQS